MGQAASHAYVFTQGCQRSGHRRQAALDHLGHDHPPLLFALALIRCDDWAGPVRQAAEAALRRLMERSPTAVFEHLELLSRLRTRERMARGAWAQQVLPVLTAPAHRDRLWQSLTSGSGAQSLFVAGLLADCEPDSLPSIAEAALASRNPVFARWSLRMLQASAAPLPEALLERALQARNASVRAFALRWRIARAGEGLPAVLRRHLLDRYGSVRHVAAFHARRIGINPMAIWRDALDAASSPLTGKHDGAPRHALSALCERATAEDAARVARFIHDPTPSVRVSALTGRVRADAKSAAPLLQAALRSDNAGEVRAALRLGRDTPRFIQRATFTAAWAEAASEDTRAALGAAITLLPPWDALDTLLDCLEMRQTGDAGVLAEALAHWGGARIGRLPAPRCEALLLRIAALAPNVRGVDWARIRGAVLEG